MAKKKRKLKSPYQIIRLGTGHFLRGGAGAHVDRKKEQNKRLCREKPPEE